MSDKLPPSRWTPLAPDEVVLPLPQPMTRRRWAIRLGLWLAVLLGWGLLLRFDIALMRWRFEAVGTPTGTYKHLLVAFRSFGEAGAVVAMLAVAAVCDRRRYVIIATVILAELLAAGLYNAPKLTIVRYRPQAAIEAVADLDTLTVGRTWEGWQPVNLQHPRQSFPSGHSGAAFAFATVMAWFYPRWRGLCFALAAGCVASRYLDGVHWLSDCLAGAAIGYGAAWMVLRPYAWALPVIWYRRRVRRRRAQHGRP